MTISIIKNKSFDFALEIITLYKYLSYTQNEYVLSKQLLRSGTSIGANVSEALDAQSKRDFLSKMNIAFKETNETKYWLMLLLKSNYLSYEEVKFALNNSTELYKILTSIVKTTKQSLN